MAAEAGPAPWNKHEFVDWTENPFREKFRRINKTGRQKEDLDWSLSGGWRAKKSTDWDSKPTRPNMKAVRLYTGRTVYVPDADYEDFFGFHAQEQSSSDTDIGAYIDGAKWTQSTSGAGHIVKIEYAPMRQLLSVTFETDGAEVVFFRVPKEVYSELLYLAESGSGITDRRGVFRHNLGIRFWDIVRIRGVRDASRYRYEYITTGARTGTKVQQESDAEMEAEVAARGGGMKSRKTVEQEYTAIYDQYAKGSLLSDSLKKDYAKLTTLKEKESFMRKHGII
jgi:hypothetical protein